MMFHPVFAANPAIAAIRQKLDEKLLAHTDKMSVAMSDNTGYAEDKNNKRQALLAIMLKVRAALAGYYRAQDDTLNLEAVTDFSDALARKMAHAKFFVTSKSIHDKADPVKNDLAPWIVTAADVDDLKTKLDAFGASIDAPKNVRTESKQARAAAKQIMNDITRLLEDLDIHVAPWTYDNLNLASRYKSARAIDRSRTKKRPRKKKPAEGGEGEEQLTGV